MNAVFATDEDGTFQSLGTGKNFCQQLGFARIVGVFHHGGTDGGVESFFHRQRVIVAEECQRFCFGQIARVFRERLRGNANGLDFISGSFERSFSLAQKIQGVLDLFFVMRAVEADESRDSANFWLCCH
jgi:hypothetical protein